MASDKAKDKVKDVVKDGATDPTTVNDSHHSHGLLAETVQYPDGNVLLRNLARKYPAITHGEGLYLFDQTGMKYLDASGGAMVVSIGHGNKTVAAKICEQMSKVSYVNGMHFTTDVMERFATKLSALAPEGLNRVVLLGSGSEAIEAAVKFVRQLWVERGRPDKSKFIARSPGYHGNTLFALSASARPYYRKFYGPLLNDVIMIPSTYGYRSPVSNYEKDGAVFYADELEKAILTAGAENIAGLLVEPVIGSSAGAALPPPGYFERVQALCKKHEILLIADEVLCGAGRTGKFFASDHFNLKPDLLVLGKGINGGMSPMSCVLVKNDHVEEMKKGSGGFMHAQTYMQSPTSAATGLAVLEYFEENNLVKNCENVGAYFQARLQEVILPLPFVGNISGIGLLAGVEFVAEKSTKKPFDRKLKKVEGFLELALKRGLVLWPNTAQADGVNGDLVMLAPPLITTKAQVDEIVALLASCVKEFFA
jgi:adenosylmethionine-8-amino-7-oxononanoate aminotransferase